MQKLTIITQGDTARVYAPYDPKFPELMRSVHGVWDKPNSCWWVSATRLQEVRTFMREIYGTDDLGGKPAVSVIVTFSEGDGAFRRDYVMFGKVLAHATSMTSGATPGPDVTFLQGAPESGGSSKNWCSVIPKGAVVRIDNVSGPDLEKQRLPGTATMQVLTEDKDSEREKLIQERRELMKRIEQIDLLLNEE